MPTDPNMTGLIYPTEGDDPDIWDTIMNTTCWPVIGSHDHTFGKGVPVPIAGLLANQDWLFSDSGTRYAISDLKAIGLAETPPADVAGFLGALFVSAVDSNLYYRTVSGVNVKIIDGSTLNVSIVGGIGGDYSSIEALLDYDDASDTYRFRQEAYTGVRQFAKISAADLIIREYLAAGNATVPPEAVTIKSPAALAASYALTLFAALPAATATVTLTASGQLTAGTLTRTISVSPSDWKRDDSDEAAFQDGFNQAGGGYWIAPDATDPTTSFLWIPITVPVGAIVTGYTLGYNKASSNTHIFDVLLVKNGATLRTDTVNTNAPGATTLAVTSGTAMPLTIAATSAHHIRIGYTGGANPSADTFTSFEFTYTAAS